MARWVRSSTNCGFALSGPVLVCICQAHWLEKSGLTCNSKIWYKIPVVLMRTGYINLTKTLEAQPAWVTLLKLAQMPPSNLVCRLALITAPVSHLGWGRGGISAKPLQPSASLLATLNPLPMQIQKNLSLLPVCEFPSQSQVPESQTGPSDPENSPLYILKHEQI